MFTLIQSCVLYRIANVKCTNTHGGGGGRGEAGGGDKYAAPILKREAGAGTKGGGAETRKGRVS